MQKALDLTISICASDDTTGQELAEATQRLFDVLSARPDVLRIAPEQQPAPAAAKSGVEIAVLGTVLLQVAPAAIEHLLRFVQEFLSRPGSLPTKVTVKRRDIEVAVEFDPRRTTAQGVAALARTLAADLDAG